MGYFKKMNYTEEIIQYLKNTEGNLMAEWTENTTPLSELNAIADESLDRNNPEGKIAALFIYHQLTIEIIKSLIIYSNFFIKISIYPTHFTPKKNKADLKFGEIINQLKYSINFKGKEKIFKYSKELNDLRNEFGHRILDNWGYSDIDEKLSEIKPLFENLFSIWIESLNDLREKINKAKEKPELQTLIKK